jgi:hypothetical protein
VSLRRWLKLMIFLIELLVIAAIVWGGWKLWHVLET